MESTTKVLDIPEQRVGEVRKSVVLDTSVLLADPECIWSFKGCDVVIPLRVIEELDNHKSRSDDVGRAARAVARTLESLREKAPKKDLREAVALDGGSTLRITLGDKAGLDEAKSDNRILAAALALGDKKQVELVSADVNLRIKAAAMGLEASEYRQTSGQTHNKKHPGWRDVSVPDAVIEELYAQKWVPLEKDAALGAFKVNEFAVVRGYGSEKASALGRVKVRSGVKGLELKDNKHSAWGLKARSKEQAFALDLLMDPRVPVVGLSGAAGTGKTILAVAAALEQTFERNPVYERVMILRPVIAVGQQDLGYLPGTLEEKLGPWMEAITDAMVALGKYDSYSQAKDVMSMWVEKGQLTLESVTYLRGRSLQKTFVIVDEAQNLEPLTLKTILTRVGEGTKAVLVGDITQIDNPWTSEKTNAISVLAEKFTGQEIFGHLVLEKGERSEVADLAAQLL